MILSEITKALSKIDQVSFILPTGEQVPAHFHVTEVGSIDKNFIDCGGTIRKESNINFQLWTADDHDHRLSASKLKSIIELSEKQLGLKDGEVEVEYQSDTIGKYGLTFDGASFLLTTRHTDCLAKENCGIPEQKPKARLSNIQEKAGGCAPGSGCC